MNFIDNIEIKNFKSIRHQKIEGCKRVNVFIGYPNVGKSNILEAIGLLTFIRQKRPVGLKELVRFERFTQIFNYSKIQEEAIIEFNDNYSLNISYEDEERLKFRLIDKKRKNTAYDKSFFGLSIGRGTLGSSSSNDLDDFSGQSIELQDFKVKPYKFSESKIFNKNISALELDVPFGKNMFEVIINKPEMQNEFSELLKPYGLGLVIDTSENDIKVSPKIQNGIIHTIPISLVADTLIRLVFFKTAICTNKESVLIFEEPEAHLFPRYISKLTGEIILNENNNQYFMATHSPYVLNDLIDDLGYEDLALFIVSFDKEKGETVVQRMTESEMNEAYQFGYDFFMNINNFIQPQPHD